MTPQATKEARERIFNASIDYFKDNTRLTINDVLGGRVGSEALWYAIQRNLGVAEFVERFVFAEQYSGVMAAFEACSAKIHEAMLRKE